MRYLLILLLCGMSMGLLVAQDQRKADSIKLVLEQQKMHDTTRCSLLGRLAYYETDPKLMLEYAGDLLELATSIEYTGGIFNGYYYTGNAKKYMGNLTGSLDALFKSLTYGRQLSARLTAESLTSIADVYKRNDEPEKAIEYYNQAVQTLSEEPELSDENIEAMGRAYLNAGDTYLMNHQPDSALPYFERVTELFTDLDYPLGLAYNKGNIGLVYAEKDEHDLAERYITDAVEDLQKLEDYYAISIYYTYMADIYAAKNDFSRALFYAKESYRMAHSYQMKEQIRDASLKLYELNKSRGDYQKALDYHEEYLVYKDSVTNRKSIQEMADLRTEFEVGQKQTELDLAMAQNKIQRLISLASAAFAVIFVILALIIYRYYRSKARVNRQLEEQKRQLESLNQTKDKFFSIISHDLRGPVSSFHGISRMIKYLVKTKDTDQLLEIADDIDDSVDRLSSLLDNLLTWAMQQQGHFPNVPEKLHLKELAEELVGTLKTMAEGKKIELKTEITDATELWADKNTTMTILRNLVNNALKFTPEGGKVTISAIKKGAFAEVKVSDTGVGIPEDKLNKIFNLQDKKSTYGTSGEKGLGLGLQLVYEFVEMNGGSIAVNSEEDKGTVFTVRLPLFEEEASPIASGSKQVNS